MSNGTPPITTAPVPPSIAGIPQPVFGSGSATTPSTPIDITGSPIIPTSTPPGGIGQIGDPEGVPTFPPGPGDTAPVAVPVGPQVGPAIAPAPVPPSVPGYPQPQFGSGGVDTPATLFPGFFTTDPPSPPIVFANIMQIGTSPPPSTPGIAPIVISEIWAGLPSTDPPPVPFPNPPLESPPPDSPPGEEEPEEPPPDDPPPDEETEPASARATTNETEMRSEPRPAPKPRTRTTRKKR